MSQFVSFEMLFLEIHLAVECTVIHDYEFQDHNQSLSSNFFSIVLFPGMSAVRVLVSGAAGNIGYAILPMIVGMRNGSNF